jgi:hypothetical protein
MMNSQKAEAKKQQQREKNFRQGYSRAGHFEVLRRQNEQQT